MGCMNLTWYLLHRIYRLSQGSYQRKGDILWQRTKRWPRWSGPGSQVRENQKSKAERVRACNDSKYFINWTGETTGSKRPSANYVIDLLCGRPRCVELQPPSENGDTQNSDSLFIRMGVQESAILHDESPVISVGHNTTHHVYNFVSCASHEIQNHILSKSLSFLKL